ncbi:acetate/propionate family kinase [Marinobacter litoralis]|uniref:acetate/propionate family kinase n=1 Tax=Marinobacter litoralis TaxID=187981 RepID=UPI0018EC84F5|nr:acetate kinase [Marinobacter litoralis]MBJ6138043.1 acetate kinase [Marinobacter litoralis]
MDESILVVNSGSSSVKLALFNKNLEKKASALAEKLNNNDAVAHINGISEPIELPQGADHQQALQALIEIFTRTGLLKGSPFAIGHRVVHGGETFREAALIDAGTISAIKKVSGLAPLHNPVNLVGIDAMHELFPSVPQVAVFDTAYHQTLPEKAFRYALPKHCYEEWGVRRYGFHGTSHSFMVQEAARLLGKNVESTSIISAHLGNGCSITAIQDGKSVDTSMGLTPLEGLVMGTRSGDVDPGLFDYLSGRGVSASDVHAMLNNDSGLMGLSGHTNDMRTLCELAEQGDKPARLAIDVFCFRLARYIGAMTASLSHLDAVVFTGGIGENSAQVRQETIKHLGLLGLEIDPDLNQMHGKQSDHRVSHSDSRFAILTIPTNEELVIAQEASRLASN